MQSDKIIVSWASTGRENYPAAQLNLIRSCITANWDGDFLMRTLDGWCDEYLGVKILQGQNPQSKEYPLENNFAEIPYGFKPAIIQEAREMGYKKIIYLDSTMRLLRDPQIYFDHAKKYGIASFENLGHPFRNYVTDISLERLNIKFDELDNVKNIMACGLVFDFDNIVCSMAFDQWIRASHDGVSFQNGYGSTRPEFVSTRHDQSCLAGILYKHGIPILPYGGLAYKPHHLTGEFGEVTFLNHGVN